jgi:hypothetical protein
VGAACCAERVQIGEEIVHYYLLGLKQYAVFGGRSRRREFWGFVLIEYSGTHARGQ